MEINYNKITKGFIHQANNPILLPHQHGYQHAWDTPMIIVREGGLPRPTAGVAVPSSQC